MSFISNLLITKFKGVYTLKAPYDLEKNEFNRKLNGTYEDIDVYIPCRHKCQIFSYGHGVLQFYCPSLSRGRNIVREIYSKYVNDQNVEVTKSEYGVARNNDTVMVQKTFYKIIDDNVYLDDISNSKNMIYGVEETDSEVLFFFHNKYMSTLEDVLKPLKVACNRSPFSTKNLQKSSYKIPDEDLVAYKKIIQNVSKDNLITLVHISNDFIKKIAKKSKESDKLNEQRRRLGMKPKEYFHYIGKWNEYLTFLQEELDMAITHGVQMISSNKN